MHTEKIKKLKSEFRKKFNESFKDRRPYISREGDIVGFYINSYSNDKVTIKTDVRNDALLLVSYASPSPEPLLFIVENYFIEYARIFNYDIIYLNFPHSAETNEKSSTIGFAPEGTEEIHKYFNKVFFALRTKLPFMIINKESYDFNFKVIESIGKFFMEMKTSDPTIAFSFEVSTKKGRFYYEGQSYTFEYNISEDKDFTFETVNNDKSIDDTVYSFTTKEISLVNNNFNNIFETLEKKSKIRNLFNYPRTYYDRFTKTHFNFIPKANIEEMLTFFRKNFSPKEVEIFCSENINNYQFISYRYDKWSRAGFYLLEFLGKYITIGFDYNYEIFNTKDEAYENMKKLFLKHQETIFIKNIEPQFKKII